MSALKKPEVDAFTAILEELKSIKSELASVKNQSSSDLLSRKEISLMMSCSEKFIHDMVNKYGFPRPIKIGSSSRWKKTEIEFWLEERKNANQ